MIYKLQLSTKESINISEEEFKKFKENINSNFIEFKEGIVNPSFVVCAVIDWEATREERKYLSMNEKPQISGAKIPKEMLEKFKPDFLK